MVMSKAASFADFWVSFCGLAALRSIPISCMAARNFRMHSQSWLGACRDSFSLCSVSKLVEESSGHL
jgi:hypothetical protein